MMRTNRIPIADDWCVLRTAGASTKRLAQSLGDAGFDAWTPIEVRRRRKPRSKTVSQVDIPMLPTFVFARADRLADLAQTRLDPRAPFPSFSIFHYLGSVALIAGAEIERLRVAERREAPKERRRVFTPGATVRVPEGPFGGMTGVVKSGDDKFTLVAFNGRMEVKIATFLLAQSEVQSVNPARETAAEAA